MKIENHKDKIKYEIHICDQCALNKNSLITIFRMKRSKARSTEQCVICQSQTNATAEGIADSETELNHMIAKLKQ